jgi:hypothetical protein
MHVLTQVEVEKWSSSFPKSEDSVHYEDSELFYTHPEANCIDVEYPAKLERLPFFARCLATLSYQYVDFRGAMLWFSNWGVWNPLDEAPGYRIVEAIRIASGQPKSFEAAAGHNFRADELDQAIGSLLQPIVFGWDANYYPLWSYGGHTEFFIHVSHDSYLTVVTRTKEFHDRVFAQLQELKLSPKPSPETRRSRYCRVV